MIEVRDLVRRFGPVRALDGVSFRVPRGSVAGLLGPNGAGKTTAERIMLGALAPTSGLVRVAGFDASREPIEVRRRVGYLPENTPLHVELRVVELLRFRGHLKGLGGRELRRSLAEVIEICGLWAMRRRLVGALSRGYRQRVGLADALLGDPPVLILDEPTSGLDPLQRREILALIRSWEGSKTVLLSSHVLSEVESTCERILLLHEGRLLASGTPAEVRRSGRNQLLELELQGACGALPFEEIAGVVAVTEQPGGRTGVRRFTLECAGAGDALAQAIGTMTSARGARILTLHERSESLEDVFVRIVSASAGMRADAQATQAQGAPPRAEPTLEPAAPPDPVERRSQAAALAAVLGREFLAYFRSPLGWGLLFLFQAVLGWLFFARVIAIDDPVLRGSSRWAVVQAFGGAGELSRLWFLFLPPLITMRLLAEERRSGTLEGLLSAPVRSLTVILGKYLAAWFFLALLWAPGWFFLAFAALQDARPDWGLALCQYLSILALGGVGLAAGLFSSSLFASQVLAGALAFVLSMVMALPWLLQSLAGSVGLRSLFARMNLFAVWDQGLRRGLVDSAHLALFAGLILLFLGWTWLSLEVRRWR